MRRFILGIAVVFVLTGCQNQKPQPQLPPSQALQQQAVTPSGQASGNQEYLAQGVKYLQEANAPEAVKSLLMAIQSDPQDLQAYLILGQTYMHLNDFDNAAQTYSAALRVAPDQGEVYYLLAIANGLQGKKEQAVQNAEKSLLIFQKERNEENFRRALVLLQGLSQ
ncbi:MAG TPA: tetratricopeptide repeat protein [Candidatus Omnitrophota bacterium]|jgi:Tfp pilus assembly protein PilF|nr:tetratricopeptide repeat protein [Candidatus Omnitrophota bacterium]HSA30539.1 tetratricopeptide repeat protein [Candidatus Omnitrophota bacterium]